LYKNAKSNYFILIKKYKLFRTENLIFERYKQVFHYAVHIKGLDVSAHLFQMPNGT